MYINMIKTIKAFAAFFENHQERITSNMTALYLWIINTPEYLPSKEVIKRRFLTWEFIIRKQIKTPYRIVEYPALVEVHFKGVRHYEVFSTRPQSALDRIKWRRYETCFVFIPYDEKKPLVFGWYNQTLYLVDTSGEVLSKHRLFDVYQRQVDLQKGDLVKGTLVSIQKILLGHFEDKVYLYPLNEIFQSRKKPATYT